MPELNGQTIWSASTPGSADGDVNRRGHRGIDSMAIALLVILALRPLLNLYVLTSFGGVSLGQLWGAAVLAIALAYLAAGTKGKESTGIGAPILFLLALCCLLLTRPEWPANVFWLLKCTTWLSVMLVARRLSSSAVGQRAVLRVAAIAGVLTVLAVAVSVLQGRYGVGFYNGTRPDVYAEYGPHALATVAVLLMPFGLVLNSYGSRSGPGLLLTSGLLVCVLLSFVRSAYLAAAVLLLVYAFGKASHSTSTRKRNLLMVGALSCAALGYWFQGLLSRRLADMLGLNPGSGPGSSMGSGRWAFWGDLVKKSVDSLSHIAIGRGAGSSTHLLAQSYGMPIWAHNDPLELMVSGGLLLVTVYVGLVVWSLRVPLALRRDRRQSEAVREVALIGFGAVLSWLTVAVLSGVITSQASVFFGLFLGFLLGLRQTPGHSVVDH